MKAYNTNFSGKNGFDRFLDNLEQMFGDPDSHTGKYKKKNGVIDQVAAQIILESYFERSLNVTS